MNAEIMIVDHGRGPQLSTSRITVQDLFPYFRLGYSDEQIIRDVMPSLSAAEIGVVRQYVEEHQHEVLEEDKLIREWNASRKNPPEAQEAIRQGRNQRLAWLKSRKNRRPQDAASDGRTS
ncbi:MAG TPA: DUF433 domain-containing protein [Pirellulales bacterium]|nr:DUF433 domain-containing protein [Pirellulales bacterium]